MSVGSRAGSEPTVARLLPAAAGSAAATAVTVAVVVHGGAPFGIDTAVRDLGAGGGEPGLAIAGWLTLLGGGPVLYPLLLVLCGLSAARRRSARELLPMLALVAGQVLELVLFATLHRPVPTGAATELPTTTYSSGHTAAAVLGWGLVVWQATRLRRCGTPAAPLIWTVALGVGLMVGWTRIYLGLHWVTDAVAGLATGVILLAVALAGLACVTAPVPRQPWWPALRAALVLPAGPQPVTRRWWHWLRNSRGAWCVPAVAAAVQVGMLLATPAGERMKDLLVYHGAGAWAGTGQNVYAFRTDFAMPFTYPPFGALVLEPLSRMPLGLVQALWTAGTLAAVVALAATVLRPVAYRIGLPLTVAALLVSAPIRSHLRFGQVGVFLVLLVTLDLLRRGRVAGWGVGLAAAIKLTPAVFLPWLALTRQWRRLAGTVAWLGGATLAGLVLLWPSSGAYLRGASTDTTRFGLNHIPGNQSMRGMLLRALPDSTADRLWLVLAVVVVGIGMYQAWRCERAGNRLAAVGVLAAASVAASPISWVHHLIWLAVPIAALAAAGRFRLVAGWFVILVMGLPFLGHQLSATLPYLPPLIINLQGLTAVAAVFLLPALVLPREAALVLPREDRPGGSIGSARTAPSSVPMPQENQ